MNAGSEMRDALQYLVAGWILGRKSVSAPADGEVEAVATVRS